MAAKPDLHTQERRDKFRSYCESKGWRVNGRWLNTEIAAHFGRAGNQIQNYLGDHGSFGPSVANEMAINAGLPPYFFEPTNTMSPVAFQLAKIFDSISFPDDASRDAAFNAAAAAIIKFLPPNAAKHSTFGELGR